MESCDNDLAMVNDCKISIRAHFVCTMFSVRKCGLITAVLLTCFLSSCATHTGTGALAGAGLGAAAGSTIGKEKKQTMSGALIGAALGATFGAILDASEKSRGRREAAKHAPAPAPPYQPSSRTAPAQRSQWPASRSPSTPPPAARATPPPPLPPSQPPSRTPTRRADSTSYPTATRTEEHGIVISPYPPNNKVNVRNFPSGSIAVDPTSNKRFRVP